MPSSRRSESAIPGLNALLRDLRALPKEAQAELRSASADIATRHMAPAWRAAAHRAGVWGAKIADSVSVRRDRIPAVSIGGNRKVFSGGATATMVRYPSHAGRKSRAAQSLVNRLPPAFTETGWMNRVQPSYIGPALQEWSDAVGRVCRDFNNGKDF